MFFEDFKTDENEIELLGLDRVILNIEYQWQSNNPQFNWKKNKTYARLGIKEILSFLQRTIGEYKVKCFKHTEKSPVKSNDGKFRNSMSKWLILIDTFYPRSELSIKIPTFIKKVQSYLEHHIKYGGLFKITNCYLATHLYLN